MKKINPIHTFKVIRTLPLEIPFTRVEQWVLEQSLDAPNERQRLPFFLTKWWDRWNMN